jgi:hypothetical protein
MLPIINRAPVWFGVIRHSALIGSFCGQLDTKNALLAESMQRPVLKRGFPKENPRTIGAGVICSFM